MTRSLESKFMRLAFTIYSFVSCSGQSYSLASDSIRTESTSASYFQQPTDNNQQQETNVFDSFYQQGQEVPQHQDIPINNFAQPKQSVFSSFSSYLLGPNNQSTYTYEPQPNPYEQANYPQTFATQEVPLITQSVPIHQDNIQPVPLFKPNEPIASAPICPPQGPANTYRRATGLKRPTYAPIPGLSNQPSSSLPPSAPTLNYLPTEPTSFTPNVNANVSSAILNPIPPTSHSILTPIMSTMAANKASSSLREHMITQTDNLTDEQVVTYRPVYNHWFYKKQNETDVSWTPFSMMDSMNLEEAYLSSDLSPDKVVATDGGRYDVNILRRERNSIYWKSPASEVRRCSWFHKGSSDGRYVPYDENIATKLEGEFKIAFESNTWNRKVELETGENIIFHSQDVLVLFPPLQSPDAWGNTPNHPRPRVVKRGMDEFHIEEGEPAKVDHLLFLVHGIGSVCDLKFRTVEEVVDEFRSVSLQLVQSHYRSSCETGIANRVEVLPISWHEKLHSEDTGVDKKLKGITLESIPRLRHFANDTILDVLFYTSPVYCQTIISSVANEMNRIYDLFKQRNPEFQGGISLGGHSLGSLILFDILCHQHQETEPEKTPEKEEASNSTEEDVVSPLKPHPKQRRMSRRISYMMGEMGTGQPQLNYPHLNFNPRHFFALGSPIGMFVTVRGLDTLGEHFSLPTCPSFFNIFHPYDPVAYRIESLVNPELAELKPVLIPHHKGRKRMHLEFKETMARVGADLKQRLVDSMKNTWNSVYQFTLFKSQTNAPNLEEEVDKVLEEQLQQTTLNPTVEVVENEPTDLSLGILNQGKRIDYVLQEAPLEFFNEYIFALTSHVCYWESEDTMLLILKEIYNSMNISTDSQIPQQTMTIERPPSSPRSGRSAEDAQLTLGVDPTMPMMGERSNLGPPPTAGFVRKT
ncbi:PREDICTED: phospholipase DDHD2 isoform X2 [Nicrophorus vespilloides]|uniref:Phospholipase DDHD2 isoform X2 n=1 Tax=Nicrophorus vespilloides TaxID=110193 RepID=A0ABM1MYR1_NICVS|nr:PREDICTED: phospholipase DDHD2 isoform X2 [Nicrophorus vespilloides]